VFTRLSRFIEITLPQLRQRIVSPIRRYFLKRLEIENNLWTFGTPWDYVQSQTNFNVHKYIGLKPGELNLWVVVGGSLGDELPEILNRYPTLVLDVFEPSNRYHDSLASKFEKEPRVSVRKVAISDKPGVATFFETSLEGSGSLLPLGIHRDLHGSEQAETFDVQLQTLRHFYVESTIDVLQIDVQGAEMLVLLGAGPDVLRKTRAILIEVSMVDGLYVGGASWSEIHNLLEEYGFIPAIVGCDTNLTGNALFVKRLNH
jgi:FkbM family methyltransferase